ncbi:hypothetical protein [Mycoplasma phocimorsus]|uniref:hypothetical protein n=1 Tax=Mycoplasma phocimorsus TaxID=3045839 RepID=UPI0024BF909B|nr:hypothetical protein [Mycoplasma phocimorsus]MDJ1648156.1 hypothetical protein [Mycoplasma phocimorsus]
MKIKNMIRWISTTVGITSSFLISASTNNYHTYEIQYENTDNIDVNNLTKKYNSNVETKLVKAKAKNGFIFLGWKLKDETIIDTIEVGTKENIILSPVLINEYPNYSSIKNLFIDSSSKINFDIKVIEIKQLINKEELAFGNEKYQLQKLIVEAINNFDNKLMHDTMNGIQFVSGSHISNEVRAMRIKASVSISNSETTSVWGLLWKEAKRWWNNWLGTAFYGLIGVGTTIGIGYSAYTSYWKNKRNFKLKNNQQLKIKLDFYPEEDKKNGNWFGYFYNEGSSIQTECSCQRKFKQEQNSSLSIIYILNNGPTKPELMFYNLADDGKKENYYTNKFPIKDYFPGSSKILLYGFESNTNKKIKLGNLLITRELIEKEEYKKNCDNTTKQINHVCNSNCCKSNDTIKKCCIAIEEKTN